MPALALADALMDFGAPDPARPMIHVLRPVEPQPLLSPPVDETLVAKRVADAVIRAETRMRERHEEELAALKSELEARHAAEIDAFANRLSAEAGIRIGEAMQVLESTLTERTGNTVARTLGYALAKPMAERAVSELAQVMRKALSERDILRIHVSGPASLRTALAAKLGSDGDRIVFTEADSIDLTAALDETLYATRLGDWSARLAEVLK